MNQEQIIKVAEKHGGTMVYVWGAAPKVDNLDLMGYTQAILNALAEEHNNAEVNDRDGLRDGRQDSSPSTDGRDAVASVREGPSEVQLGQKGRKKANTKVKESIQEGAKSLREGR
jgi:hypothetical protein